MDVVPPVGHVDWPDAYRIVPARQEKAEIFSRIADAEDHAILESLMPPAGGDKTLLLGYVQAPFLHINPSRFSDGGYGVYYAAYALKTAVAETCYHRARFLRHTRESAMYLPMQVILAHILDEFHDLREKAWADAELYRKIYSPHFYESAQRLAKHLKKLGSRGMVYHSVRSRDPEQACVAVFHPPAIRDCRFGGRLLYHWNGDGIDAIYQDWKH